MTETYLLDTNVILRLILKDNLDQYNQVIKLMEQGESGKVKLYCSTISIFETIFVLTGKIYQSSKLEVIQIIQTVLNLQPINFEEQVTIFEALEIFSSHSLSFPDCYLLAKSKINQYKFFSFDQKAVKIFNKLENLKPRI
ncbi:MAG: PIN domain-containing protein [bacterium]